MPRGAAVPQGSSGENITHFVSVRMRLQGEGNLNMSLYSIDDIRSIDLVPFVMSQLTNIQPTRLCNFNEQRASLQLGTTEFGEWFRINRILVFTREFGTMYPG